MSKKTKKKIVPQTNDPFNLQIEEDYLYDKNSEVVQFLLHGDLSNILLNKSPEELEQFFEILEKTLDVTPPKIAKKILNRVAKLFKGVKVDILKIRYSDNSATQKIEDLRKLRQFIGERNDDEKDNYYEVSFVLGELLQEKMLYGKAYEIFRYLWDTRKKEEVYLRMLEIDLLLERGFSDQNKPKDLEDNIHYILLKMLFKLRGKEIEEANYYFEKARRKSKNFENAIKVIFDDEETNVSTDFQENKIIVEAILRLGAYFSAEIFSETIYYFSVEPLSNKAYKKYEKIETTSVEDMKKMPIFKNLRPQQLSALHKEGLLDKKSFKDFTENDVLAIEGIGKTAIEKLKKNGVVFSKKRK